MSCHIKLILHCTSGYCSVWFSKFSGLVHSSGPHRNRNAIFLHKGANSFQYLHVAPWGQAVTGVMITIHCNYSKSTFVLLVWQEWHNSLYSNLSSACSWVYCSNKALKQSDPFFFFKGMHAFPFTSEINSPLWYTNLAVSSLFQWLFFSCLRQETNTGGFVLHYGQGWDPPTPYSNSTWCWEMRRETGVTHDLQWSHTTGLTIRGAPRGRGGWSPHKQLHQFSSYHFPSHWQILGGLHTPPRLSSKIIPIRINESLVCVCITSMLHEPFTLLFSRVHPSLTLTKKDDPSDKEGNTK